MANFSIDPNELENEPGVKDLTPKARKLFAKALANENREGETTQLAERALKMAIIKEAKGE